MPSPWKRKETGIYYIRVVIPVDLISVLGTTPFKETLGTKDPSIAKPLFVERYAALMKEWAMLRAGPQPLSHKQRIALAGTRYKDNIAALENDPETVTIWERVIRRCNLASETPEGLETTFGAIVDTMLKREGLLIDTPSRALLLQGVCRADRDAAQHLLRNAEGNYSPDPKALWYPDWQAVKPPVEVVQDKAPAPVTLTQLFNRWEKDHLSNKRPVRTVNDFRYKMGTLITFLGHENAEEVTPRNISDWLDDLRDAKGLSARTIGNGYLSAIRAIYRLALSKSIVTVDPTAPAKVSIPKRRKTRTSSFTTPEVVKILACSLRDPSTFGNQSERLKLAFRWVPWICAYTGARGGEITQLRKEDLLMDLGFACLRITPEAGTVKTNAYRIVPVHPHLIEQGFLAFIASRPPGPLFYEPHGKINTSGNTQAAGIRGKVGGWVRKTAGVNDPGIAPNHGWRHTFITRARDCDIAKEYRDAITGHSDGTSSEEYGDVLVTTLHREIQLFPRYDLPPS